MTDHDIHHDPTTQRFVIGVDGVQGYLDYELADGVLAITHSIVPPAIGGRGIAGRLVQAALAHAHDAGFKVDPRCSYADAWMRRHPELDGLRA